VLKLEIRRLDKQRTTAEILEKLAGSVLHYERPFDLVGADDWDALK